VTEPENNSYGLVCPFWIDTDAYSDRDRAMFVAGYEFALILRSLEEDDGYSARTIHRENESRVRMAAGRFGRRITVAACPAGQDPSGTWSFLEIEPKEGTEP
jgi:hypothetical protein